MIFYCCLYRIFKKIAYFYIFSLPYQKKALSLRTCFMVINLTFNEKMAGHARRCEIWLKIKFHCWIVRSTI